MAVFTRKLCKEKLDTWLAAEESIATGQSYQIGTRMLTRANLKEVREEMEYWAGKLAEIQEICHRHGALIVEDAAESLGATYRGIQTGTFGQYNIISFNGNKIITGSAGGMLLCDDEEAAHKAGLRVNISSASDKLMVHASAKRLLIMFRNIIDIIQNRFLYFNVSVKVSFRKLQICHFRGA